MFYTWGGVWMPPHLYGPIHLYAPYVCTPPGCTCPPYAPILFYASVFLEALHVVGGCNGLPFVLGHPPLHHPCLGVPPPFLHPHTQLLVPYALVCFRDISMLCGHFPSVRKGLGCSPISWGVGSSALEMSICSFLYLFCSALCLTFDSGSNYCSSSHSGIFWPVFCVISDSGSFLDRVSSKLRSAWCASTTTLDAKRLWRCSWLSFCATAATSIFNVSFSLCQLCYGFSTGRFLFQS